MRRALALSFVVFAVACASSQEPLESGKAFLGDQRLRVRGPAVQLTPGGTLRGRVLYHSVVDADVSVDFSGLHVDAVVPRDFWTEVEGYLLDLSAGATARVQIDGPRVQTLVRRIGSDASQMNVGNEVSFSAGETGTFLIMVLPSQLRPGSDHIEFDITASTTPAFVDPAEQPADDLGIEPAGTWSCDPSYFGSDDGCDCGCGAPDPDCGSAGCTEPGCSDATCSFCYDGSGADIGCWPAE